MIATTAEHTVAKSMRILIGLAAALSILLTSPAAGQDNKLYKWVDEDGNVTYQDQPPPDEPGEVETFAGEGDTAAAEAAPDVDVVLYAIDECGACDLLRNLLRERGVPFQEKNVQDDPALQAELKEVAGALKVPVLTIGDEVFKGYNKELVLNELDEAGFATSMAASAPADPQQEDQSSLSREDLEGMTPAEVEQAARDAASRGEDNDLFEEDEGYATLNEDIFSDDDEPAGDDITQLQEIPEDERISVGE